MRRSKRIKSAKDTGIKDVQRETTENIVYSLEKNPLKIPVVLDHLFNIVDYDTLKACRIVSSQWKDVSDPIFIERSVFVFENKTENKIPEAMLKSPVKMKQLFGSIKGDVYFNAFKFQHDLLTGPAKKMYFNPNMSKMTQLEIKSGVKTKNLSNIDRWIHPQLKKLIVSRCYSGTFVLSLGKLVGISHISLEQCKLNGTHGKVKLKPKELILKQIQLENPLERFGIADFVDFRNLQVLNLDYSELRPWYYRDETPYLNFSNCVNIKTLSLNKMNINLDGVISPRILELEYNSYYVNGKEITYDSPFSINDYILEGTHLDKMILHCDWDIKEGVIFDFGHSISVDNLHISDTIFMKTENNGGGIKIKDLTIFMDVRDDEDIGKYDIDISYLPDSLESLEIVHFNPYLSIFTSSGDVCFPQLKQLSLEGCQGVDGNGRSGFALFDKCPLLADISLIDYNGAIFANNDEDTFTALKRLELQDVVKMTLDNTLNPKVINLDVLVISSGGNNSDGGRTYPFEFFATFRAKLVVFFEPMWSIDEKTVTMIIRMKQTMNLQNIAFGPVEWKTDKSFKKSLVFPIVEIKSEYYLLEGDGGKSINRKQLLEMTPSNKLYD